MSADRARAAAADAAAAVVRLAADQTLLAGVVTTADRISRAIQGGGRVLLFGNGGSAADAQHIAAELVGRFARERTPLPAEALTTNTSILTAVANDYGYDQVFARQVDASAGPLDVVVGITTSGRSSSVLAGLAAARSKGSFTVALTGLSGRDLAEVVDVCLVAPDNSTPRVQECHLVLAHMLCELVEELASSQPEEGGP